MAAVIGASVAHAQQTKRVPRVAYVYIFKEGPSAPFEQAFRQGLRDLGWIDGHNVVVNVRDADGSAEKLGAIMQQLVDSKVDVIVTACTPEAKAAAKVTSTIPIVIAATGDAVGAGLAQSLARPGGNVTGVSAMQLELSAKRMALLKEAFPELSRATVLWNPGRPDNAPEVKAMQTAAEALSVRLDSLQVRTPVELADALDLMPASQTQGILNAGDTLLSNQTPQLMAYTTKWRVPALYDERSFVDQGGLGPVHTMSANANGRHEVPIEALDEAKTGRLGEESNAEWRLRPPVPFGLLRKWHCALLRKLARAAGPPSLPRLAQCHFRPATHS